MNLFLITNSRQLLLAIYIANLNAKDENFLILDTSIGSQELLINAINETLTNIFTEIIILKRKKQVSQLKSILLDNNFSQLFSSNVNSVNNQFIFNELKRKNAGKAKFTYLEDGTASYYNILSPKISDFKYLCRKIKYGLWYRKPGKIVEPNFIDEAYYINYQLTPKSIRNKSIHKVNLKSILAGRLNNFKKYLFNQLNFDISVLNKMDILIILERINNSCKDNPNFLEELKIFLLKLISQGKKVAIKQHPNDAIKLRQVIPKDIDLIYIPSAIYMEFLVDEFPENVRITGHTSTAMIDFYFHKPNVTIAPITFASNPSPREIEKINIFKKLGIKIYDGLTHIDFRLFLNF